MSKPPIYIGTYTASSVTVVESLDGLTDLALNSIASHGDNGPIFLEANRSNFYQVFEDAKKLSDQLNSCYGVWLLIPHDYEPTMEFEEMVTSCGMEIWNAPKIYDESFSLEKKAEIIFDDLGRHRSPVRVPIPQEPFDPSLEPNLRMTYGERSDLIKRINGE